MRHLLRTSAIALILLYIVIGFAAGVSAECEVTLQWDPNSEPDLAGYRLFLREEGQYYNYAHPVWEDARTACSVSQLAQDTMYYFVVRAFDNNGYESGNSNEVRYPCGNPPNVSSNLSGSSSGGSGGGGCFIGSLLH